MKLLLVGSTGLVGRHVLALALADARVTAVVAPVRRARPARTAGADPAQQAPRPEPQTSITRPALLTPVIDFDNLDADASWWRADAVICTLGTTIRDAGSREAFRRVDHDYPLAIARIAHDHGTPTFALNSALGADPTSAIFYNRVKGEVERDLATVGFRSLTLVRPGLIGGHRDSFRLGERVASAVLGLIGPVLPRRWRINPAPTIAAALLEAAIAAAPGHQVIASDRLS